MRNGDEPEPPYVSLRPYSAEATGSGASGSVAARKPRSFAPKAPNERRVVERAALQSAPVEVTASSMLHEAWRKQEQEGQSTAAATTKVAPERFKGMNLSQFGVAPVIADPRGKKLLVSPGSAAGSAASAPPRQAKVRKEGQSQDLTDLAFTSKSKIVDGELRSNYTPISLPYYNVREEGGMDGMIGKQARPTMVLVDSANANAAKQMFLNEQGGLQEHQLLLMQLPAILPELADPLEEVQRDNEDAATAGAGAAITRFPDGKLGKLKIYKSGKVRMELGGLQFCVDQGCETSFQQDLACVCPLAREIISLGAIRNRAVLTPDIKSMLDASASVGSAGTSATASVKAVV